MSSHLSRALALETAIRRQDVDGVRAALLDGEVLTNERLSSLKKENPRLYSCLCQVRYATLGTLQDRRDAQGYDWRVRVQLQTIPETVLVHASSSETAKQYATDNSSLLLGAVVRGAGVADLRANPAVVPPGAPCCVPGCTHPKQPTACPFIRCFGYDFTVVGDTHGVRGVVWHFTRSFAARLLHTKYPALRFDCQGICSTQGSMETPHEHFPKDFAAVADTEGDIFASMKCFRRRPQQLCFRGAEEWKVSNPHQDSDDDSEGWEEVGEDEDEGGEKE
tara:strand:- start:611 stop:1444 length:834 start_codon:yes stop_codon:yes gene_type:complete